MAIFILNLSMKWVAANVYIREFCSVEVKCVLRVLFRICIFKATSCGHAFRMPFVVRRSC